MRRREVVRKLVVYTTDQKLVIGILTRKEKGKMYSFDFLLDYSCGTVPELHWTFPKTSLRIIPRFWLKLSIVKNRYIFPPLCQDK